MGNSVPLKCTCGSVKGIASDLSPSTGMRVVCMCIDCQTYAEFLGRGEEILDEHGGTDIYQLRPKQVRITEGADQLRAVRQSPKGAVRFYADCCKTPVGNLADNPKLPFVGMPHLFMDHEADGRSREEALGPVQRKIQGKDARGSMPEGADSGMPRGLLLKTAFRLFFGWLGGAHKPSPFFGADGKPVVVPTQMERDERKRLKEACRTAS